MFENYEQRIDGINKVLEKYNISSLEEAKKICLDRGIDVYNEVKNIQKICFEDACWAYTLGAAIAIKKGDKEAKDEAEKLAKRYNVSKEEFIAQVGGIEVLKNDLRIGKAIDVLKK